MKIGVGLADRVENPKDQGRFMNELRISRLFISGLSFVIFVGELAGVNPTIDLMVINAEDLLTAGMLAFSSFKGSG